MEIKTLEVAGMIPALKGMRNPMNSWDKADNVEFKYDFVEIGPNDLKLAQKLIGAGSEHCKFMRQIQVWADIGGPRRTLTLSERKTHVLQCTNFSTKNVQLCLMILNMTKTSPKKFNICYRQLII